MRVDRGASRGLELLLAQHLAQLGSLIGPRIVRRVEDLRDRTPTRPARHHALLIRCRGALLVAHLPTGGDGGEVRREARLRPGRGQIVLAGGPERYGLLSSNVLNCAAASFAACSLICDGSNPISGRTCSIQSSLTC